MKIKIELDGLTLEQANGLTNFLSSLNIADIAPTVQVLDLKEAYAKPISLEEGVKEEKPKQVRKKAEKVETPQDEETFKEDTIPEPEVINEIEVVDAETVSPPTLMQIRSLVAQKAAEHKEAIKSKLIELGAQNVSTLDTKHFQTIFDFLNVL